MAFEKVQLEQFKDVFGTTTELSSEAIGGKVLSVSDEFFAAASQLLEVEPAPSMKGQFGPNGALFSGWESRRHNPAYDWCIIKLGTTGVIEGFDVDTSHFNGNEAPQVSVEALHASEDPHAGTPGWTEILPKVNLGPSSRHLFKIPTSGPVNYVKLNMYPDGGIARFRVYGHVSPVHPEGLSDLFDVGHVFSGARVEFTSDQHFGAGANLILPGRGKNMGGGWETKRSRQKGHRDWVILKLGAPGFLEHVKIDTHHFKGNFPESCEIHALYTEESVDWSNDEQKWELILPRAKLGPPREHYFQLDSTDAKYSHIKFTIYPDGGLQRIRIFGRRELPDPSKDFDTYRPIPSPTLPSFNLNGKIDPMKLRSVPVLPLTPEAFEPFGKVIQAYEDHTAAPKGTKIGPANYGTASKFHKLSLLESSYPEESGATSAISVYRCQPVDKNTDGSVTLKTLERHPYTNQAFIPMSSGAKRYLVVVAKNGDDDRPDMTSLRGFIATSCQGIVYNTAIWHQPMTVLENVMDFA